MKVRWILMVLLSVIGWNGVNAKEAYAVLYPYESVSISWDQVEPHYCLTFYFDDERTMHENELYDDPYDYWYGEDGPSLVHPEVFLINGETTFPEWNNKKTKNYYIVIDFDKSFADYRPTSTMHWFDGMNINGVSNIENLNTSLVTDMSYMFAGCKNLKDFFYHLDFSSVENMSHMVDGLEEIVLGAVTIPSGVNTIECFKSLQYVELISKFIELPEDFFSSTTQECNIVFPDDFDFGTDTSNGHFTWKGGTFYGGICEPYAIFKEKTLDFIRDCGSYEYSCQEYYLNLYYDKLKGKRIQECKKEDSDCSFSWGGYDDDVRVTLSSKICEWNKWNKKLNFNEDFYGYNSDALDAVDISDKPALGNYWSDNKYFNTDFFVLSFILQLTLHV